MKCSIRIVDLKIASEMQHKDLARLPVDRKTVGIIEITPMLLERPT
jgi:hypothetical protein